MAEMAPKLQATKYNLKQNGQFHNYFEDVGIAETR